MTVCDEWLNSFENFYRDMGEPPPGFTIERIDNDLGYSKENCKWIPKARQSINRSITHWVVFRGENMCLKEYMRQSGWHYKKAVKMIRLYGADEAVRMFGGDS